MLDTDEMRMRNVRSVVMYLGDGGVRQLDVQRSRVRGRNGGRLGDADHVVNRLQTMAYVTRVSTTSYHFDYSV